MPSKKINSIIKHLKNNSSYEDINLNLLNDEKSKDEFIKLIFNEKYYTFPILNINNNLLLDKISEQWNNNISKNSITTLIRWIFEDDMKANSFNSDYITKNKFLNSITFNEPVHFELLVNYFLDKHFNSHNSEEDMKADIDSANDFLNFISTIDKDTKKSFIEQNIEDFIQINNIFYKLPKNINLYEEFLKSFDMVHNHKIFSNLLSQLDGITIIKDILPKFQLTIKVQPNQGNTVKKVKI